MRVVVDRPVDEVFDFLADLRNEGVWNPPVMEVDKASDGPIAAGTIFDGRYKGVGSMRTELKAFERPRRFSFQSAGPRMQIAGVFTLAAAHGGTSIARDADLQPLGPFKLLALLVTPLFKKQNAAAATRLTEALEAHVAH
jgi:hypothetical protein